MDSLEFSRAASTLRRLSDSDKSLISRLRTKGTKAEDKLWSLIRKDQILGVRFRRQHKIGQFIVDFFSVKCKLAIEVDGEVHVHRVQEDEARTQWLNSLGIGMLRFSNTDVFDRLDQVRAEIEKATREGLSRGSNEHKGN